MKVTIHNYKEAEAKIDWSAASQALQVGKTLTEKGIKHYSNPSAATAKDAIDKYFLLLETVLKKAAPAKKKAAPAPKKVAKAPAAPKQTSRKAAKEVKEPAETTATVVEHITTDIALVRRFTNLHGKSKNYDQLLSIWRAFEKAIVERKVTKGSPYKDEIAYMKESLTGALRAAKENGTIELVIPAYKYRNFKAIADSVARSLGVSILLEFINISGRARMQERAKKLQARIKKALAEGKLKGDRYIEEVRSALKDLDGYVGSKKAKIEINDYYLSGVGEIALHGCKCGGSLHGFSRGQNAVILKLIQEKAKNFNAPELNRVFVDTVAPDICKLIVRRLVDTGQLTMRMIRNPAKPKAGIALSGVPDEPEPGSPYDFNAEVMDMRLRSAGRVIPMPVDLPVSGLSGFSSGVPYPDTNDVQIISASELVKKKFKTIGLTGKYRRLIGDPEPGFSMMIFGKPKQGKSTVAIDFAKDLTSLGKVLYVAFEEGAGFTLQDKVIRNNANVPGLDFSGKLPRTLSGYRYVFIDSVTDAGYNEAGLKALIKANKPNEISIIGVFHATKAGNFKGGQSFAHDVDVLLKVENGIVHAQGRYAPPAEMSIAAILPAQRQAA
ncbi:MAG: hypothetical protein J0H46_02385 [Bacteroidetes bacterium]|nr:hypothetical protein [Bacteroidota bacterium]